MDAAFVYRNNKIYFFKGDQYWKYDERASRLYYGYPRTISRGWVRLTGPMDAAITWSNRASYFFKGKNYLRIETYRHRVQSGYPKNIALKWMKCDLNALGRGIEGSTEDP